MHIAGIVLFYSVLITSGVAFLVTLFHEEVSTVPYLVVDIITFIERLLTR